MCLIVSFLQISFSLKAITSSEWTVDSLLYLYLLDSSQRWPHLYTDNVLCFHALQQDHTVF